MTLESWAEYSWLTKHTTSPQEIKGLLSVIERDLQDCKLDGLSVDGKHNFAYNAALQAATITLAASGYRAVSGRHHYVTIQALKFTMGLDRDTIEILDTIRGKRATADYDTAGTISDSDASEAFELALELYQKVKKWLMDNHSHLLK